MVAYLGTQDMRIVEERVQDGDEQAGVIYQAMAYQVSKEIGALSTVVNGKVDAIALTGGMAKSERFVNLIKEAVAFIAPVHLVPGEEEMRALALGALRVLKSEEQAKVYKHD